VIRRKAIQGSLGKKVSGNCISTNEPSIMVHTYNHRYTGSIGRRIMANPGKNTRSYLKN
jgi:hypothetical protein